MEEIIHTRGSDSFVEKGKERLKRLSKKLSCTSSAICDLPGNLSKSITAYRQIPMFFLYLIFRVVFYYFHYLLWLLFVMSTHSMIDFAKRNHQTSNINFFSYSPISSFLFLPSTLQPKPTPDWDNHPSG